MFLFFSVNGILLGKRGVRRFGGVDVGVILGYLLGLGVRVIRGRGLFFCYKFGNFVGLLCFGLGGVFKGVVVL